MVFELRNCFDNIALSHVPMPGTRLRVFMSLHIHVFTPRGARNSQTFLSGCFYLFFYI